MHRQLITFAARLTVVAVVFSICSPALAALLVDGARAPEHHDAPCPDGDGDGGPCGGGCGCLCCPGHAKVFVARAPAVLDEPRLVGEGSVVPDEPHPGGISQRIFRPPRSA